MISTEPAVKGKVRRSTKIAFVIWSLAGMGGSERVVYDIVRNMDRGAFSTIVIGFEDGPARALYENMGVKTAIIMKEKKIDPGFVKRFRRILMEEEIDIVNPHHFSPLLYSMLATRFSRVRLVYTEHSRWQLEQLPRVKKIVNWVMLQRADAVVAISDQIMEYYTRRLWLPKNRVHLVNNGIEISAFQRPGQGHLRQKLGITGNAKVIGAVANIRPEKNHRLLVAAFSALLKRGLDLFLVIVGHDYLEGEIQSFARRLGVGERALFLGKREDVPGLLSIFDVFCLPSIYEGLPLTVLEAMAAGIPVVGADVLGINEVVRHNENGLLFPSNEQEKLEECLHLLLEDDALRRRLSLAGRDSVKERYSIEKMIENYEHLFRSV